MRFITGAAVGFVLGWAMASRLRGQESEVDVRREALGMAGSMARHPSAQGFRQRVVDLTGERGLEAIRRARASIQRRLEASTDDVSLN
jgi:hypothetical protein